MNWAAKFIGVSLLPLFAAGCGPRDDDPGQAESSRARAAQEAMVKSGLGSLEPGLWKSSLKVTEIDLPSLAAKRRDKITRQVEKDGSGESCLDADAAKAPPPEFFAGSLEDCRYGNFTISGGKARISLSCQARSVGAVDMELSGPIAADSFRFDGKLLLRLPMIGSVPVKAQMTGRHVGHCD